MSGLYKKESESKGEKNMSGNATTAKPLTDEQVKILEALAEAEKPCGSKDISAATGLETKAISSQIAKLKKQGLVESPVRCKYSATEEGKIAIR